MSKRTITAYVVDVSPPAAAFLPAVRDALLSAVMVKAGAQRPHDEVALITYGSSTTDNAPAAEADAAGEPGQYAGVVNASRAAARARWGGPPSCVPLHADADGAVAAGLLSVWHAGRRAALLEAINALPAAAHGGGAAPPPPPPDLVDALLVAADAVSTAAAARPDALQSKNVVARFVLISPLGVPPPCGPPDAATVDGFTTAAAGVGGSLEVVVVHPPAEPGADAPPPRAHPALAALAPLLTALPHKWDVRLAAGPEGVLGALADPGVGSSVYFSGDLALAPGPDGSPGPASIAVKVSKLTAPARPPPWEAVIGTGSEGGGGGPHAWAKVGRDVSYRQVVDEDDASGGGVGASAGPSAATTSPGGTAATNPHFNPAARVPAWRYGGEWVPVPSSIKGRLGYGAPKSLSLVGVAVPAPGPAQVCPPNGVWLLAASPAGGAVGVAGRAALGALAGAVSRTGGAALFRWVARESSEAGGGPPRLYAGYPALPGEFDVGGAEAALEAEVAAAVGGGGGAAVRPPARHPACFVLVELPFFEDVRPLHFPSFPPVDGLADGGEEGGGTATEEGFVLVPPSAAVAATAPPPPEPSRFAPTPAQVNAALDLVDAWDVSTRPGPEAAPNPVRARALAWIAVRAVAAADAEPGVAPVLTAPPVRLSAAAETTVGGAAMVRPLLSDPTARCVYPGGAPPGSAADAAAAAFARAFKDTVREVAEPSEADRKSKMKGGGAGRGRGGRSPTVSADAMEEG